MAAIDLEREAFKVDQASLKEEFSTMTSSLEKMADDILAVRQDMPNMSARFLSHIADFKQLILNMSAIRGDANKANHRQDLQRLRRKREQTNQWKHMKISLTMWQPHGPTCANLKEKATLQIKIMFHNAIVNPSRARLGRTDVCLTHHG
jgi:hypothetical protein